MRGLASAWLVPSRALPAAVGRVNRQGAAYERLALRALSTLFSCRNFITGANAPAVALRAQSTNQILVNPWFAYVESDTAKVRYCVPDAVLWLHSEPGASLLPKGVGSIDSKSDALKKFLTVPFGSIGAETETPVNPIDVGSILVIVCEIKLSWKPEAWIKMSELYLPVVNLALNSDEKLRPKVDIRGLILTKKLDPKAPPSAFRLSEALRLTPPLLHCIEPKRGILL